MKPPRGFYSSLEVHLKKRVLIIYRQNLSFGGEDMEKEFFIGSEKGDVIPKAGMSKLLEVSREEVLDQLEKTRPEDIKILEKKCLEKRVSLKEVVDSAQAYREFTVSKPYDGLEGNHLNFNRIRLAYSCGVCDCCNYNYIPFYSFTAVDSRAIVMFTVEEDDYYDIIFNATRYNEENYIAKCSLDENEFIDLVIGPVIWEFYNIPIAPYLNAGTHRLVFIGELIAFRGVVISKYNIM